MDEENLRLAGERTLLAWIRTGLAMMGLGFIVARFGLFLRELAMTRPGAVPSSHGWSIALGAALMLLGVGVTLMAAGQHALFLRRLAKGQPVRAASWSMAIVVAVLLAVIGIGMTVYLLAMELR